MCSSHSRRFVHHHNVQTCNVSISTVLFRDTVMSMNFLSVTVIAGCIDFGYIVKWPSRIWLCRPIRCTIGIQSQSHLVSSHAYSGCLYPAREQDQLPVTSLGDTQPPNYDCVDTPSAAGSAIFGEPSELPKSPTLHCIAYLPTYLSDGLRSQRSTLLMMYFWDPVNH